jgi:hypothetical protein
METGMINHSLSLSREMGWRLDVERYNYDRPTLFRGTVLADYGLHIEAELVREFNYRVYEALVTGRALYIQRFPPYVHCDKDKVVHITLPGLILIPRAGDCEIGEATNDPAVSGVADKPEYGVMTMHRLGNEVRSYMWEKQRWGALGSDSEFVDGYYWIRSV